jgi:hypothetical protein
VILADAGCLGSMWAAPTGVQRVFVGDGHFVVPRTRWIGPVVEVLKTVSRYFGSKFKPLKTGR